MKQTIVTVYLMGWALYGTFCLNHNGLKGFIEGLCSPGVLVGAFLPGPPNDFIIFGGSALFWLFVAGLSGRRRSGAIIVAPVQPTITSWGYRRRTRTITRDE